ncbi:MAG: alanine--tRNA ligase-related protein, partial [Sediminibacterium sp.]
EEEAFLRTLDKGLKRIDDIVQATTNDIINGKSVFELFDTFGFPLDLTKLIAAEKNLQIDEAGFALEMQQQKNRSRAAATLDTEDWIVVNEEKEEGFVGYENNLIQTRVNKYRKISAKGKTQYQLVLATTPFYAESGGQIGDTGWLEFGDETVEVTNTKKENDTIVHFVDTLPTTIETTCIAKINVEKRLFISYNHTTTHLLHAALRKVLGTHVAQKGSLVTDESLRFDFSHFAKVTDEEIKLVEKIVNDKIRENIPVIIKEMPKEEALQLGAMALFGEKYGNTVRVVIIDSHYSVELCGGTHVMHTGMIGLMKITAESAVAAGVRRVEAITGSKAYNYLYDQFASLKEISGLLKTQDPVKAVEKIIEEKQQLEKKIEQLELKKLNSIKENLLDHKISFDLSSTEKAYFIGAVVELSNADLIKKLSFELKSGLGNNYIVALAANIEGKATVSVMLSDSIVSEKGLEAPAIIKSEVAPLIKGGGGGQKTLATAGGQDASNLALVIEKIKALIL